MRVRSWCFLLALLGAVAASPLHAQQPQAEPLPSAGPTKTSAALPAAPQASPAPTTHRFWDRENDLLFAAVGAGRALDYSSTLNLRRRGVDEILLTNSIVDNHPLFGGIEASGTAASIASLTCFIAPGITGSSGGRPSFISARRRLARRATMR